MERSEPYLILYNQEGKKAVSIESTKPFSLPQYTITATARKGDASQVFRFQEDKSRYYDSLKYGYYGTTSATP